MVVDVVVVGGGISAIGTAVSLINFRPDCRIKIIAKEFTPNTTGDGAAGMWGPHLVPGTPIEKILEWSKSTWNLLTEFLYFQKDMGVFQVPGVTVSDQDIPRPFWSDIPSGYKTMNNEQCKTFGSKYTSGYHFTSLMAEPALLLPKLQEIIVTKVGGTFIKRSINNLEEVANDYHPDLIINCSGLGSYDLVPDHSMYPIRGQVIRVNAPWIKNFFIDESGATHTYILPNTSTIVLGGTSGENDWRLDVDPDDSQRILENCKEVMPSLKSASIVEEFVGLRPARRNGVRIEEDHVTTPPGIKVPVVHNYGHGGSGITLFWGCGQEAAKLAVNIIERTHGPMSKL